MSAEYQKYENLDKLDRKKQIAEDGSLEKNRFLLSNNPELQKRLKKLQEAVAELKKDFPEIVSLNLFGSMVKGYANETSDIDGYLMVDGTLIPHTSEDTYSHLIFEKISDKLQIPEKQIHIATYMTSENEIREYAKSSAYNTFLQKLFFLSIGSDIDEFGRKTPSIVKYRKFVFGELEEMGATGERLWEELMLSLYEFENNGFPKELQEKRSRLYPWTIEEGKKYFLKSM